MSSRALRKLQSDKIVDSLDETANSRKVADDVDDDDDGSLSDVDAPTSAPKNKNKTKGSRAKNRFDLLVEEEVHNSPEENEEIIQHQVTENSKKKKKKNKRKPKAEKDTTDGEQLDEVAASVREVNELLGELPTSYSTHNNTDTVDHKSLLNVEHRFLNPANEMRRMFGSRVVQEEQHRRRDRRRQVTKSTWLVRPKDTWPPVAKSGLSMQLLETVGKLQYFTFEHSKSYQKLQFEFLDAAETNDPQNLVNFSHLHPNHVDCLLQLSEICRMSDDAQMAAEFIEKTLYTFELSFHPRFSLTQGTCRMDYRRPENRSFFLALFRHAIFVGEKGCNRTALEICKLILSLDPDGDPLAVMLMIDYYALRSDENEYLVHMSDEWESHRNLSELPNMAFSTALALYHTALRNQRDGSEIDTSQADLKLQDALLRFPSLLLPLLDKCEISPDSAVSRHSLFSTSAQLREPASIQQLTGLYVGRCSLCWKSQEVAQWLESNVREVMRRADQGDPLVTQYATRRRQRYQGTPRNIHRHILVSEVKEATTALPPEVTSQVILSYDPLPPADPIVSYTRPPRPRRAQQSASSLSMFLQSLLPSFNPQEVVEQQEAGAAGGGEGAGVRQGVATLMDTMRELLNQIQLAPPPREDGQQEEEEPEEFD